MPPTHPTPPVLAPPRLPSSQGISRVDPGPNQDSSRECAQSGGRRTREITLDYTIFERFSSRVHSFDPNPRVRHPGTSLALADGECKKTSMRRPNLGLTEVFLYDTLESFLPAVRRRSGVVVRVWGGHGVARGGEGSSPPLPGQGGAARWDSRPRATSRAERTAKDLLVWTELNMRHVSQEKKEAQGSQGGPGQFLRHGRGVQLPAEKKDPKSRLLHFNYVACLRHPLGAYLNPNPVRPAHVAATTDGQGYRRVSDLRSGCTKPGQNPRMSTQCPPSTASPAPAATPGM